MATATRPFPLPADIDNGRHVRPCVHLARAATAHLRAFVNGRSSTPDSVARSMFAGDVVTLEILRRSASAPAMTTVTGWAKELAGIAIYDLIQSITTISASAEIIGRGLRLSMDSIAELRVPGRTLTAAAAGMWVQEGGPAPARQLSFTNAAILHPRKLSVIMAYSREQAESSNIENIVRATLGEAAGLALDAKMFSADAGTAAAPAGLFAGVAPLTATAGGGQVAMEGDLKNLFTALAAQGAGKTAVVIAAQPQAVTLKMTVGPKFDYPIVESTGLAAGTVAAIEIASFVSGFSPVPEFRVSNQTTYHAEDSSPQDISGGTPSPAVPVRSLWQTDSIALKMDVWAAYGLRAAGHAQFLTGATW
jgi:hypothetical protein